MRSMHDHWMVGAPSSGNTYFQNLYGMYVRNCHGVETGSNLEIAKHAYHVNQKPVCATSLGCTPDADFMSGDQMQEDLSSGQLSTSQIFKVTRDWKDVMVCNWKTYAPEQSFAEFAEGPMGFSMLSDFVEASKSITAEKEWSYEDAVNNPHQFMAELVHALLPHQDNPDHPQYGLPMEEIDQDMIDVVVQDSGIRRCREGTGEDLMERVGIWKEWLTPEESELVHEWEAQQ
jgi:hypothetical protein